MAVVKTPATNEIQEMEDERRDYRGREVVQHRYKQRAETVKSGIMELVLFCGNDIFPFIIFLVYQLNPDE